MKGTLGILLIIFFLLMTNISVVTAFYNEQDENVLHGQDNSNSNNINSRTDTTDDWPMYGHDPAQTSFSTSSAPREFYTLWTFNSTEESSSAIHLSPAVHNNKVFLGTDDSKIHVLQADTGEELWQFTTGAHIVASPAVSNDIVVIGSYDTIVYALDTNTGRPIWKYRTDQWVTSPAIINDGMVFIGTSEKGMSHQTGRLYAFDLDTTDQIDEGIRDPIISNYDLVWYYNFTSKVEHPPVVRNGNVYLSTGGILYVFDEKEGTLLKEFGDEANYWTGSPAIIDDKLFLPGIVKENQKTISYFLRSFNIANFELLWEFKTDGTFEPSTPSGSNGEIFFSGHEMVYAIPIEDPNKDGIIEEQEIFWTYPVERGYTPSLTKYKVVVTNGGDLYCLERETGSLLWSREVVLYFKGPPVIAKDKIYISGGCIGYGGVHTGADLTVLSSYPSDFPVADIKLSSNRISTLDIIYIDASDSYDDVDIDLLYFDLGDGTTTGWTKNQTITHSYSKAGTYTIKLKVKDYHRLVSNFTEVNVTVINRLPILPKISDMVGKEGNKLHFDETIDDYIIDPDGKLMYFELDYGDGTVLNESFKNLKEGVKAKFFGRSIDHTYKNPGEYKVTLSITDDDNGTNSTSFKVTVKRKWFWENIHPDVKITIGIYTPIIIFVIITVFMWKKRKKKKKNKRTRVIVLMNYIYSMRFQSDQSNYFESSTFFLRS